MASAFQYVYGTLFPPIPSNQPLMKTVEKLVAAGELAGFSVQDMIDMLNGGLTVADLLVAIGYCLHDKRKPHS